MQNLSPTRNITQNSFKKLLAQVSDRSAAIFTPKTEIGLRKALAVAIAFPIGENPTASKSIESTSRERIECFSIIIAIGCTDSVI